MTEVEMDIDTMHQPSLEVPVDDDLINYESDAGDYTLLPADDLKVKAIPEDVQETYADAFDHTGDFDAPETSEAQALGNGAVALSTTIPDVFDNQNDIEQVAENDLPIDTDAALDSLTETAADEIDYNLGDMDYHGEHDGEGNDEVYSAENLPDASEEIEAENQDDKAEISWEDDEDVAPATGHLEMDASEDKEQEQEQSLLQLMPVQVGCASEQPKAEDDESESRDYRQDELQALEEAITGDTSMDASGESPVDSFPSITVQYQGDEFPFLSTGTEGFFSHASILDESIQNVLSGFRSQVGNDVSAQDELVFQVDELGLEFTESSTSSNITMHQVLEVFDLLVKNDDPDGTRTLYTYLFTRLNNSRRYEFLVESATTGKGLDEVQHLFPQQSSPNDSDGENEDESAMSSEEHAEEGHEEEYTGEHEDQHAGQQDEEDHEADHEEDHEEDHEQDREEDHEEDHEEDQEAYGVEYDQRLAEQYNEEPAADQQEIEYFDESAEGAGEASHLDDPAATRADYAEPSEEAELEDRFVHERSSTTSTLQGDADATGLSADADDDTAVDAEADGPVFVAEANDDAEIDWRDDDENDIAGDGGSVTGKRTRDDSEEPDMDDEIDFKRRRP